MADFHVNVQQVEMNAEKENLSKITEHVRHPPTRLKKYKYPVTDTWIFHTNETENAANIIFNENVFNEMHNVRSPRKGNLQNNKYFL